MADGRNVSLILLCASLIFWGAGCFCDNVSVEMYIPYWVKGCLEQCNVLLLHGLSFVFYAFSAILMNTYVILERRVSWQPCMMLWMTAVCFCLQVAAISAFALLLLTAVIGLLFLGDRTADTGRFLYYLFAFVSLLSVFFPPFLLLLPVLYVYPVMNGKLTPKSFAASLLGIATPVWIIGGIIYVYPSLQVLLKTFELWISETLQMPQVALPSLMLLMICAELILAFSAVVHFFTSASIGKTRLRRRMMFCMMLFLYLWLLGWLQPELFMLFFIWRLPVVSLFAAYILSVLSAKVSNIYMLSLMFLWLAVAILNIWIG